MAQHQEIWPVAVLCEVLAVSRSGFYAYMPAPSHSLDRC